MKPSLSRLKTAERALTGKILKERTLLLEATRTCAIRIDAHRFASINLKKWMSSVNAYSSSGTINRNKLSALTKTLFINELKKSREALQAIDSLQQTKDKKYLSFQDLTRRKENIFEVYTQIVHEERRLSEERALANLIEISNRNTSIYHSEEHAESNNKAIQLTQCSDFQRSNTSDQKFEQNSAFETVVEVTIEYNSSSQEKTSAIISCDHNRGIGVHIRSTDEKVKHQSVLVEKDIRKDLVEENLHLRSFRIDEQ